MDPATVAILMALGRIGVDALIAFLEHPRTTEAEVIAALKVAKDKSLEDYIAEDAAARPKALPKPFGA